MSSGGWTGWSWAGWWSSISFPFFYLVIFLKWVSSNITFPPFGDDVQLNKFSTFFVLFCLILPKVGNCVWQIESNTKSIKKTAYLLLKGESCFWSIQPIKNSIMKALSCCLRYFCLETQDLKSLFMQRHLVHFLIYNRLSFQKRDVWNGSREINGFCQQIHFLLYFL